MTTTPSSTRSPSSTSTSSSTHPRLAPAPALALAIAVAVVVAVAVAAAPTTPATTTTTTTPSALVAFGDSWSDNGNVYRISNGTWPPSPPYDNGRFSNGPVWLETLAGSQFLNATLRDFAYGSGTTNSKTILGFSGANSDIPVPAVDQQIAGDYVKFLANSSVGATPLYSLWSGGNDLFFDYFAFHKNLSAETIASDIIQNVDTLITSYGARRLLLLTLPNITHLPFFLNVPAATATLAADTAAQINALLPPKIHALQRKHIAANAKVLLFDVAALIDQVVAKPAKWGFANVTDACVVGGVACAEPGKYVFWDQFHFTGKTHQIIGEAVAARVGSWLAKNPF